MIVTDWAVKNRIVAIVVSVAAVTGGVYSYLTMPREAQPEVKIPWIFVTTNYKGVSPVDVENSITVPIEKEIKGISGITHVNSTSSEGMSRIAIEFDPGVDIEVARQKVKDAVDAAEKELPVDLDSTPTVAEFSIQDFPVVSVVVMGDVGLVRLKEVAEKIGDDFESIPGVLECDIAGGLEREIIVEVDLDRAVAYGLPMAQVTSSITSENLSISGGTMRMADGRFQVRVPGEFETPEDAQRIVVAVTDGKPVYLADVAKVVVGHKDEVSRSRLDYKPAVTIYVKKRVGANAVEISEELDRRLARWQQRLPSGVLAAKIMDMADFIRWLVSDLENNLLSGFVLVLAVVFFAMGFRNALLVSVSIPLSILISFVVLDLMGVTLNMMVLFSTILALGMLVDNAIVIVENIYRYMQAGVPRVQAACRATSEVAWPITGSTLTTIAAFSPLLFWTGIMGQFMYYVPLTVITTLAACLFVALVINPAVAAYFMKVPQGAVKLSADEVATAGEKPTLAEAGATFHYQRALRWCLRHRAAVLVFAALIVVLCVQIWMLAVGLRRPLQLMPTMDPNNLRVDVTPPVGAGLVHNDAVVREIERRVRGDGGGPGHPSDLYDIKHVVGRSRIGGGGGFFGSDNRVDIHLYDLDERTRPTKETTEEIRRRLRGMVGAEIRVAEEEHGPPTGAPINVEIVGENLALSGRIAKEIRDVVSTISFVRDVQDDYYTGAPTFRIKVDRKKAALLGLSTQLIGFTLKSAINGIEISTFREAGEDYDITVRLPAADRDTVKTLERFFLPTLDGKLVPLSTVAEVVYEGGYASINRRDFERAVTVSAQVDEMVKPGPVARAEAEELLAKAEGLKELEGHVKIRFTGQFEEEKKSRQFLAKAFLMAVFLIAAILIGLFSSVTKPLIILTSVALSTGGAFLGLAVAELPFIIIMSGVGIISLAGVVVNNAIVLVDYTEKLRARGLGVDDAVVAAGATRLRPVILTAITTVLGLIPLVSGVAFNFRKFEFAAASQSTQWWTPMAICVIFGLGLATFLTLFVVPCLWHAIESARQRLGLTSNHEDEPCP